MTSRVEQIEQRLNVALAPEVLEISDDSKGHAGHAGNQGGGHFGVFIVSAAFDGKSRVQRHQQVYAALGELMQHEIHALSMKLLTPEENSQQGTIRL